MDELAVSGGDRTTDARVFLSYAAEDLRGAERLASILTDRGWDVWWDRRLFAGSSFDEEIEQQLDAARAVIVLWSPMSVHSEWVRAEATTAIERDALVPIIIEPCRVPLRFRNVHTLDLSDWDGDPVDDRFNGLERALRNLMRVAVADEGFAEPARPSRTPRDDQTDDIETEQLLDQRSGDAERVDHTPTTSRPTWFRWWYALAAVFAMAAVLGLIASVAARDTSPVDPKSTGVQEPPHSTEVQESLTPPPADETEAGRDAGPDFRSDGLDAGDWMYVGDTRVSTNGRFLLLLQEDGNLVVEDNDDPSAPPVWSSRTHGHPNAGALMQPDGNFIIFGDRSSDDLLATVAFTTETAGNSGAVLTIRNDGALVVESPTGTELFSSND